MKKRIMKCIADGRRKILGLLYPHTCPLCGKTTAEEICGACADKLLSIAEPRCMKCGKPIRSDEEEYCYDCAHRQHEYERGYGMWVHQGDVQASVYRFKYQNRRIYSEFYAKMLAEQYGSAVRRWKICLIIPIPLYRKRRRQRGYNQSELVAKKLGKILDIPVDSKNLRRVRNTNPQKKMSARGRRTNLRNAFRVRGGFAPVQSVLLIDDIYTTGNTIDCAARELKKAGVQKVYFLTISIGQGY